MRMFNADGSEAEMCGNGIRCVAKYSYDHGLSRSNPMRIETGRGVLGIDLIVVEGIVREATVNMGPPVLELEKIPVDASRVRQDCENPVTSFPRTTGACSRKRRSSRWAILMRSFLSMI